MLDGWLRAQKDRLLAPVARPLARVATPNGLSLLACAIGVAAAGAAWRRFYAWGLVLWLVSRVCDGLDGTVARVSGRTTDLGGYLDILLDFVVYAAIPIALAAGAPGGGAHADRAALILLASFYVNAASWMYLAAILERRTAGGPRRTVTTVVMPEGLVGGAETIVFYVVFFLLPGVLAPLFIVMAILVGATIVQRLWWASTHL
jgi:phosphatidylglycerophosphate synthase